MILILVYVMIALTQGYPHDHDCNSGPSYWCLNAETAEKCGVAEFCKMKAEKTTYQEENQIYQVKSIAAPPVNVSLYYESLCPGCRNLIKTQIYPTYQVLKSTGILNIFLHPFGNAVEYKNGTKWIFTCQHGEEECLINLVETCALHLLTPPKRMPFIHCIEESPSLYNGRVCAEDLDIKWAPIEKCYKGSQGNYFQHEEALQTKSLNPPHKFVPWITVNGVHTEELQNAISDDMLKFVCNAYTGLKPDACNMMVGFEQHSRKRVEACYKD